MNPLPRLIPRHWKDQQTNKPLLFFFNCSWTPPSESLEKLNLQSFGTPSVLWNRGNFQWKLYIQAQTTFSSVFFSSCPSACQSLFLSLSFSLSVASRLAGCFQRKRCRPSGLFINMLNGEQVFGRGNKAKIIINPVRWIHSITLGCIIIGVFFFLVCGERSSTRTTKLWEFFSDDHKNFSSFFFFPLGYSQQLMERGKKEIVRNHPTPFICLWKSAAKIFYVFFLPRRPLDPLKLCSRCTQRDFFFSCYSSNTSPRPAIKRPRTLNTVLPCHWRWSDTVTDEHLAAEWRQSGPPGKVIQSVMESYGIKLPLCRFMLIKWANELSRVSRWVPGYALMYLVPLLTVNCLYGEMMEWCFLFPFSFFFYPLTRCYI